VIVDWLKENLGESDLDVEENCFGCQEEISNSFSVTFFHIK
jgi:hypothetical protein